MSWPSSMSRWSRVSTLPTTRRSAGWRRASRGRTVDVLVNCAGILSDESLGDLDFDRIRAQFEVNSLGPLRVTAALRGNLGQGSKVAIITSRMGSIEDNTSGGRYGYRMSKAAVNMAGRSLANDLKDDGVAVAILHPGFVRTDMTGPGFDRSARVGGGHHRPHRRGDARNNRHLLAHQRRGHSLVGAAYMLPCLLCRRDACFQAIIGT